MQDDPIIAEIRKIREAHARQFNYDIRAMGEDLMKRQWESGRKIVSFVNGRMEVVQEAASQKAPARP